MSTTPTDPVVELLIDGSWVDVTNDCRLDSASSGGGIRIKRGRPNESPAAEPTQLEFTVNNGVSTVAETLGQSGVYSPLNVTGPHFGKLTKNLPVRVGWGRVYDEFDDRQADTNVFTDDFNRTVASAWSNGWTAAGGSASDFSVSGGLGRVSLGTLNVSRRLTLAGNRPSGEAQVTISISSLPSGDDIETTFMLYYQDGSNYLQCSVFWDRDGRPLELRTVTRVAGVATTLQTVELGFTPEEAGLSVHAKCQWHAGKFRLKAWKTTDPEPDSWPCGGYSTAWTTGQVGLRANLQPLYTGTVPQVITFDNYQVSDLATTNSTWGSTPDKVNRELETVPGFDWDEFGTAANFDTTGDFATLQAASGYQSATVGTYADVEVVTRVRVSDRTSEFGVVLRQVGSSTDRYTAYVTPAATDLLRVGRSAGVVASSVDANLGFQVVAGQSYWFKAQASGQRFRVKVWLDGTDEPKTWGRTFTETQNPNRPALPAYGQVGLFVKDGGALVEFDCFRLNQWRAHAEVTTLPTRHDLARVDRWVPVDARGLRRRLGQGRKDLQSAVTRHLSSYTGSGGWLPLEAAGTETRVPNLSSNPRATEGVVSGVSFATPDLTGEHALPGVAGYAHLDNDTSYVTLSVPYQGTFPAESVLCFFRLDGHPASTTNVFTYLFTGTLNKVVIWLVSANQFTIDFFAPDGTILDTDTVLLWGFGDVPVGSWLAANLYLQQSGGTITWAWNWHRPGTENFFTANGSFSGSFGRFRQFRATSYAASNAVGGLSLAQVYHYPGDLPFVTYDFSKAADAYQQETSVARWVRLLREVGVKGALYNPSGGVPLGPQLPGKLLDLLDECADAENGSVLEDRDDFALDLYTRPMSYRYAPVEFDIDAGHLVEPLDPNPDDQGLRNDVTVRAGGFFAVSVQTEGPNNVNQPEDDVDGVGIYDEAPELNLGETDDLQSAADWRRAHGVLTDPRYPSFSSDLTSAVFQDSLEKAVEVLALDTGRMARIVNPEVSADPTDVLVQSYTEFLDQYDWDLTFVGTPGRVETEIGTLNYTTRVSPENAVTSADFEAGTDTALLSTGTLWVPTATDPEVADFDVLVAGVRLHVNTVTGSSAPQTLNVDATPVNGQEKTIPAGSKIELYQPWRVAW